MALRLYYFSSGPRQAILESIVAAGHIVERVFITDEQYWPKVAGTRKMACELGIPTEVVRRADLAGLAGLVRGRLCLSAGFGYLFPPAVCAVARLFLNVHGTLLPRFPGARSLNWVIASGQRESGVTVHQIDDGIDAGPILLQERFPLSPFETVVSLARKTSALEPSVVVRALALVEAGEPVFVEQADADPAWKFPDRRPEHSEIDPSKPLIDLIDEIRAADSERFPAYFTYEGQRVCVRLWRPVKDIDEFDLI